MDDAHQELAALIEEFDRIAEESFVPEAGEYLPPQQRDALWTLAERAHLAKQRTLALLDEIGGPALRAAKHIEPIGVQISHRHHDGTLAAWPMKLTRQERIENIPNRC